VFVYDPVLYIFFNNIFFIIVSAPPVLLDGDRKVAARPGHVTSFSQKIYSVSPVNVTLERQPTASQNASIHLNTIDVKQTRVALKVFDSVVEADGVTVVVSFKINAQEEFGEYQLVIANNVEPAARRAIAIIPPGTVSYNTYTIIALR